MTWTDERIDLLKRFWAEGHSARAIAGMIGADLTRNSVIGKAVRLNLPARQARGEERKKYIRRTAEERALHPRPPRDRRTKRREGATTSIVHRVSCAPQAPAPVPVDDAAIPQAQRKALLELENHHCRWPVGEPGTDGFFFCGAPEADLLRHQPYCAAHTYRAKGYARRYSNAQSAFFANRVRFNEGRFTPEAS